MSAGTHGSRVTVSHPLRVLGTPLQSLVREVYAEPSLQPPKRESKVQFCSIKFLWNVNVLIHPSERGCTLLNSGKSDCLQGPNFPKLPD